MSETQDLRPSGFCKRHLILASLSLKQGIHTENTYEIVVKILHLILSYLAEGRNFHRRSRTQKTPQLPAMSFQFHKYYSYEVIANSFGIALQLKHLVCIVYKVNVFEGCLFTTKLSKQSRYQQSSPKAITS